MSQCTECDMKPGDKSQLLYVLEGICETLVRMEIKIQRILTFMDFPSGYDSEETSSSSEDESIVSIPC